MNILSPLRKLFTSPAITVDDVESMSEAIKASTAELDRLNIAATARIAELERDLSIWKQHAREYERLLHGKESIK